MQAKMPSRCYDGKYAFMLKISAVFIFESVGVPCVDYVSNVTIFPMKTVLRYF